MRCSDCKKLKELEALFPCRKCGNTGPYCVKCSQCNQCGEHVPGDHRCGESEHIIPVGQGIKCIDCDEFDYCKKCVVKCPCGHGEDHYLCKDRIKDSDDGGDGHCCQWYHYIDQGVPYHCTTPVCKQYCSISTFSADMNDKSHIRVCTVHRPVILKRAREILEELVEEEIQK